LAKVVAASTMIAVISAISAGVAGRWSGGTGEGDGEVGSARRAFGFPRPIA
jgi:Flp pilus assembly pilin Flp